MTKVYQSEPDIVKYYLSKTRPVISVQAAESNSAAEGSFAS